MNFIGKTSFRVAFSAVAILTSGFAAQAAETQYPLTLKNCGRDVTFKHR
jgi:iron complex transport system substrate-binding protein